jgi:hypothetical protein
MSVFEYKRFARVCVCVCMCVCVHVHALFRVVCSGYCLLGLPWAVIAHSPIMCSHDWLATHVLSWLTRHSCALKINSSFTFGHYSLTLTLNSVCRCFPHRFEQPKVQTQRWWVFLSVCLGFCLCLSVAYHVVLYDCEMHASACVPWCKNKHPHACLCTYAHHILSMHVPKKHQTVLTKLSPKTKILANVFSYIGNCVHWYGLHVYMYASMRVISTCMVCMCVISTCMVCMCD